MTFGSLFAGIGGLDLGLERAGMECRWQVEIDPFCQKVLEKHWPGVKRYGDIRTVGYELERVDVIGGGFPCQPFSSASHGRRTGMQDNRFLWPEMLRVISQLRPTWVIGENVTHIEGAALEKVVSDLEACGYEICPPLEIPACAFGHDHKRARIWFIGYSDRYGQPRLQIDAKAPWMQRAEGNAQGVGEAHGIPGRLDRRRLAALGNAVVPQVAEWIGLRIMESELRR